MQQLNLISMRQVLDKAIERIRTDTDLTPDEERIVRESIQRATALGLDWDKVDDAGRKAIEHELKVIKATLISIGEKKAADVLGKLENAINAIVLRGVDMLLDRVIGPNPQPQPLPAPAAVRQD